MNRCIICEGRETVESLEWLQYQQEIGQTRVDPMPVCLVHYAKLEECHGDTMKIRTPPVVVNVKAIGARVVLGNT